MGTAYHVIIFKFKGAGAFAPPCSPADAHARAVETAKHDVIIPRWHHPIFVSSVFFFYSQLCGVLVEMIIGFWKLLSEEHINKKHHCLCEHGTSDKLKKNRTLISGICIQWINSDYITIYRRKNRSIRNEFLVLPCVSVALLGLPIQRNLSITTAVTWSPLWSL